MKIWQSIVSKLQVPSYAVAFEIATATGYGTEFSDAFKYKNINSPKDCYEWDKWRTQFPIIPTYAEYLAWNTRNGGESANPKSNITFTQGLKIATYYHLASEWRVFFADPQTSSCFWDWSKSYPQITQSGCSKILYDIPITEWADFRHECIEGSGISPGIFALNTRHIVNSNLKEIQHWDDSGNNKLEVLAALNIPTATFYGSTDGVEWNRPELLFGGALNAFVSPHSGFFNAKPRRARRRAGSTKYPKYEARRKNRGNRVIRPAVSQAACDRLVAKFNLTIPVTCETYWQVVLANPDTIPVRILAHENWAARDVQNGRPSVAILDKNPRSVSGGEELLELLPAMASSGASKLTLYIDVEEGNKVFFPAVDQAACDKLMENFSLTFLVTPENYWKVVLADPKISLAITEGAKKALSLICEGFPAVAVLGVGNWSVAGSKYPRLLLPELELYAHDGRAVNVFYDQDDPLQFRTVNNVRAQGYQLVGALNKAGAKAQLMAWDWTIGKGIDDAKVRLVASGEDFVEWLFATVKYSRHHLTYEQIANLYKISPKRLFERDTVGDRIEFAISPTPGAIISLIAHTGSGKTYRLAEAIKFCQSNQIFALFLTPTNKLGKQAAANLGLPHRNSHEDIGEVMREAERLGGMVMCPDSIQHFRRWHHQATKKNLGVPIPFAVFCDEAAKVGEHLTTGTTLGDKYSEINESVALLIQESQFTVLAEARICEADLVAFERMSGGKKVVLYRHSRVTGKRKIKLLMGAAATIVTSLEAEVLERLGKGEKVLIPVDSQLQGEKLERLIQAKFPDLKGMRNDAHTSYLPDVDYLTTKPNEFLALHQLDYLIYSPACKAGWDLTGFWVDAVGVQHEYKFDHICAFLNVLPTSDHIQIIGRYRPNIPMTISVPELISLGLEENLGKKALKLARAREIEFNEFMCELVGKRPPMSLLQETVDDLHVHNTVRNALEKSIARYSLMRRLQDDGHIVSLERISLTTLWTTDPEYYAVLKQLQQLGKEIKEHIIEDRATAISILRLRPEEETDIKIAEEIDRKEASTPQERAQAAKIRLRRRFPQIGANHDANVNLDDSREVYLIIRKHYKLANGADLYCKLLFRDLVKYQQIERNGALLKENLVAAHHLRHDFQRVELLHHSKILDLLEGAYSHRCPEMVELKRYCLHNAQLFKQYFGFNFTEIEDSTKMYCSLLGKIGLETTYTRPGTDTGRVRFYRILDLETAQSQLDFYYGRLSELSDKHEVKSLRFTELEVKYTDQLAKANATKVKNQGKNQANLNRVKMTKCHLPNLPLEVRQFATAARTLERVENLSARINRLNARIDSLNRHISEWNDKFDSLKIAQKLRAAAKVRLEAASSKLLLLDSNKQLVDVVIPAPTIKIESEQLNLTLPRYLD